MTARDLATLTDLDGLAVSPDGRWAAFLTRRAQFDKNAYEQSWHVAPITVGAPRFVADGGDPIQPAVLGRINGVIRHPAAVWSPDSQWIAFPRREKGRTHIWRVRVAGEGAEQLTSGQGDARALAFSRDGAQLLFETDLSEPQIKAGLAEEGRNGFRYDNRFFPSYSPTPVLPADVDFGRSDDERLASSGQRAQRRVLVYDFSSRETRAASDAEATEFTALSQPPQPQGRERYRENSARSPSGALAWTEARDPAAQGAMAPLTIVAQASGAKEPVVCTAVECTSQRIKGLWWRDDSEVLFARGESTLFQDTALYAWRVGKGAPRRILRTPYVFASSFSSSSFEWKCGVAQNQLVCFYEEPTRPRRLVAIDLTNGKVGTLFDPNPGFASLDLGPTPQRLEFRSPSAVESYGYLVLPPKRRASERLPLVIVTYRCGGFLRGGTGDEYPVFPFAAQGHAVLCFDVPDPDYARLATEDWGTYQKWQRGEGDPGKRRVQEGLETAVAHLDRMGIIDPNRVAITGLSFGAEATSYALWHMPRLAAAIASGVGFEPADTFLYGPAGRALLRAWGLADPASPRWNDLVLSRNAHRVRAPFLLNVADREMISRLQPVAALEDAGRAVEMYVFPDEYHIKWQPAHRLAIYKRNIDWMNFWLRGVQDPAPTKAEQYARWRAMRVQQCELFKGDDAPWYCLNK